MDGKRLEDWTKGDLERLIVEKVPEDGELEYKGDLRVSKSRQGERDPWHKDQVNVGDSARFELAEAIIAFANASGGLIILGMQKSTDPEAPNTTSKINPIPSCMKLADVLRLGCRDLVEPKLDRVHFVGLPIQPDGAGVVLIGVSQSRRRPHRHTKDRECYVRRNDGNVPMTMEEIKDLTLYAVTQDERIHELFESRLYPLMGFFAQKAGCAHLKARCVLVPLQNTAFPDLTRRKKLQTPGKRFNVTEGIVRSGGSATTPFFGGYGNWRPILRGMRSIGGQETDAANQREIFEDGSITVAFSRKPANSDLVRIYPGAMLGLAANALWLSHLLLQEIGAARLPYGFHFELETSEQQFLLTDRLGEPFEESHKFPQGKTVLPRMQFFEQSDFDGILTQLDRDLWHCAGVDVRREIKIDWSAPTDAW